MQSRYYDPAVGRFINADGQLNGGVLGCNLFAYCGNNPVMLIDSDGHLPFLVITAIIGAVVGAVAGGIIAYNNGYNVWAGIAIGTAGGASLGLGLGAAAGVVLAGSATASIPAVMVGAKLLHATVKSGGLAEGIQYIKNNLLKVSGSVQNVFYSGGKAAQDAANNFANANGGTTIDTTKFAYMANAAMKLPNANFVSVWSQASVNFAKTTKGTAYAFINASQFSNNSIFLNYELPSLLNNPNVNNVIIKIFG